jgi:hypothetical protein
MVREFPVRDPLKGSFEVEPSNVAVPDSVPWLREMRKVPPLLSSLTRYVPLANPPSPHVITAAAYRELSVEVKILLKTVLGLTAASVFW